MALTFQLTLIELSELKTKKECAILLFYLIDEISLLPHTHLLFCNKECVMTWECKHAE